MTFKTFFKACGKALIYFCIFIGSQLLIVTAASYIVSLFVGTSLSYEMLSQGLEPASDAFWESYVTQALERAADILNQYVSLISIIADLIAIGICIAISASRKVSLSADPGVRKIPLSKIPILALFGLTLNFTTAFALKNIPFPADWVDSYVENVSSLTNPAMIAISSIFTILVAPVCEELIFRGFIYSRLKTGMPMAAAILISSWLFGMVHGTMIWIIYAGILGMILCWIYEKTGSLTSSIIVHIFFNAVGFITEYWGDMISERTFLILSRVSLIIVFSIIVYIQRVSPNKIYFTLDGGEEKSDSGSDRI